MESKKYLTTEIKMDDDLIATFVTITGATTGDAGQYLEV
jgi:hypothetical protein